MEHGVWVWMQDKKTRRWGDKETRCAEDMPAAADTLRCKKTFHCNWNCVDENSMTK